MSGGYTDIEGLSPAEIKAMAQAIADSDSGADGSGATERTEIISSPKREARQWYNDNPVTRQIFDLSLAELDTEVGDLLTTLFPTAPAGAVGKLRKLLVAYAVNDRVLVHEELG